MAHCHGMSIYISESSISCFIVRCAEFYFTFFVFEIFTLYLGKEMYKRSVHVAILEDDVGDEETSDEYEYSMWLISAE